MPQNLEVRLSFRPIFDGLNRFSTVIEKRLDRVRAYNQRISAGAASSNAILQQAATFLSGAAVVGGLNRLISGGVKYNAVIEQQASAFETLLGSADRAQDRIASLVDFAATTPFQLPQVVQASKILQAFTGDALSSGAGLRLVGDAAAAVGAPFEAAAMWIGRLYAALEQGAPLGEPIQNLTQLGLISGEARRELFALQGTALSNADSMALLGRVFGFTAGAMERQSRTLNGLLSTLGDTIDSLAGQATDKLTKRIKELTGRMIELGQNPVMVRLLETISSRVVEIVGGVTHLAEWLSQLGPNGQKALTAFLDLATTGVVALVALTVPLFLINVLIRALPGLIEPVGRIFVFLAGVSFLDALRDLQLFSRELGIISTINLASWGQLAAAGLAIAGAAFAGWKLGSFINELTVGGMQVKEWAAIVVNSVIGLLEALATWKDILKAKAISTATEAIARLKILYWQGALEIVEKLNSVLGIFGQSIPVDGLKDAVLAARTELAKMQSDNQEAVAALEAAMARILSLRGEIGDGIADAAVGGGVTLNDRSGGGEDPADAAAARARTAAEEKARLEREQLDRRRALFDLETAILEATADGNQALVDRLSRERNEMQLLEELGAAAYEIIVARLDIEEELVAQERARNQSEIDFSREMGERERARAEIEADRHRTAEEKQAAILPLLAEENRLIRARIDMMEQELLLGATDERRSQLQQKIDELRGQLAGNAGEQTANSPQGLLGNMDEDMTRFVDSMGSRGKLIARLFTSPLQAGINQLRNGFQMLLGDTAFWETKLGKIAGPIMGSLTGAVADLFQQWIADRARSAIASMAWSAKEGAADTAAKTPGAILTSISSFGAAAAIGVAAVIAALATFATGGLVTGPGSGTSDSIIARLSNREFVQPADAVAHYGTDFMESIRNRTFDPAGAVAGGITQPRAGGGSGGGSRGGGFGGGGADAEAVTVNVIMVGTRREAERIRTDLQQRGEIGRIVEEDFGLKRRR